MSNEIYDLLEINREENTSEAITKPENFAQHILIHLGILFGLIGLSYYLMKSKNGFNDEILIAFIFAILLFLVFFVVLIVETIYYQVKKKFELRNAALFSILIFIASMVIILFL